MPWMPPPWSWVNGLLPLRLAADRPDVRLREPVRAHVVTGDVGAHRDHLLLHVGPNVGLLGDDLLHALFVQRQLLLRGLCGVRLLPDGERLRVLVVEVVVRS